MYVCTQVRDFCSCVYVYRPVHIHTFISHILLFLKYLLDVLCDVGYFPNSSTKATMSSVGNPKSEA